MNWLMYIAGFILWMELHYAIRHFLYRMYWDNVISSVYYVSCVLVWIWICWKIS
jgi:hypothetical protein